MKVHTTNYQNVFIEIADDCPATSGKVPAVKGDKRTVANLQYELVSQHPYQYTSDEVLFSIFAERNDVTEKEMQQARVQFFSKGQPCFRASPLTKRYGWRVHYDKEGRMALVGCNTPQYKALASDKNLKVLKAMRSAKQ